MQSPAHSGGRVLALLTLMALLFAACGDGDETVDTVETTSTTSEPSTTEASTTTTADAVEPVLLQLTFDGGSCTYEGPTELTPGPVELVFYNESEGSAAINMVSIDEGYTIQDVIDDLGPEPSTGHHPPWTHELGTWRSTAPGERHHWEGDLEAGLHAAVCVRTSPLGVWFGFGLTVEG